jgi:hypothetical protein
MRVPFGAVTAGGLLSDAGSYTGGAASSPLRTSTNRAGYPYEVDVAA